MFENLVQICPSSFRTFTPVDEIINLGTAANMRPMRVMKYCARPRLEPCTQKRLGLSKTGCKTLPHGLLVTCSGSTSYSGTFHLNSESPTSPSPARLGLQSYFNLLPQTRPLRCVFPSMCTGWCKVNLTEVLTSLSGISVWPQKVCRRDRTK